MNPAPARASAAHVSPIIAAIMNFPGVSFLRLLKGLMTGLIKNSFPPLRDKNFKPPLLPLTFLFLLDPDRVPAALPQYVLQIQQPLAGWKGESLRA